MKSDIEELRNKYIKNPPEGMTPRDIRQMSESDLWIWIISYMNSMTMMTIGEQKVFISSNFTTVPFLCPPPCGPFSFKRAPEAVFPIK